MALNDLATGLLILLHDRAVVFGIQLRRQCCRAHEVTEHYCELAALRFGCSRERLGNRGRCRRASCLLGARHAFTLAALGRCSLLSSSQRGPTCPAEFERQWILRTTARTPISERAATLSTEFHSLGILKATARTAHRLLYSAAPGFGKRKRRRPRGTGLARIHSLSEKGKADRCARSRTGSDKRGPPYKITFEEVLHAHPRRQAASQ